MSTNTETKQEATLEESFEKLEQILTRMESRDITLEEAFQTYKSGMELLKDCNDKLDLVEKKMKMIDEEGELHEF